MQKIYVLIWWMLVWVSNSYAQVTVPSVVPPSPDAAALARYAEIPVSFSTGVPEISLPIYTVKSGKLTLPIAISYHAAGVKARDIASTVGLEWVLNAGGTIARSVLGRRDESADYIAPYKTTDDLQLGRNLINSEGDAVNFIYFLQNMSKLNFETQSDRYAYNFNGKSGVFRYDWQSGIVRLLPYAPLQVNKKYVNNDVNPVNLYFMIIDESGTQYFFQAPESSTQGSMIPYTAWNLTKVVSADGKDEINLYYSTGEVIVQLSENCAMVKNPGYPWGVEAISSFTRTPHGTQNTVQRLDRIETKDATVNFSYASDRHDGRQMRLTNVSVRNKLTNVVVRQANFHQSYFGSESAHTLRMRLDGLSLSGIQSTGIENYSFVYNDYDDPGYYYTDGYVFPGGSSFPASISEDYWGYPNIGQGGIPSEFMSFLNPSELATYGGNRNPNPSSVQQGVIKEIHYPTGGITMFEFENNKTDNSNFYHYSNQPNANNNVVGGLRVANIKNYNADNSLSFQKSYTYDYVGAQQEISAVLFHYQQPVHYYESTVNSTMYGGILDRGIQVNDVAVSSSVYPLSVLGSASVIYGKVTEYNGTPTNNIGKTEYIYQIPPESILETTNILASPKYINEFTIDRGTPSPLLKSKTIFKNQNGNYTPLTKVENTYTYAHVNEFLTGIRVDQEVQFKDLGGWFSPDSYDTPYLWEYLNSYTWEATKGHEDVPLLTNIINTDYSGATPIIQTTDYQFGNLDHLQPTQKKISSSISNDAIITDYKYPHDFVAVQPYNDMVNTYHIWDKPIEQLNSKYSGTSNSTVFLQSTKTDYSFWGLMDPVTYSTANIYPQLFSTKKTNGGYEPRLQYLHYDNTGNITSLQKTGGSPVSYIWGYNKVYPIAQAISAAVNEIYSNNLEEGTDFPSGVTKDGSKFHTGHYSGLIVNPGSTEIVYHANNYLQVNLSGVQKKFRYSGWVYSDGPSVELFLYMKRGGETNDYTYFDNVYTAQTGGWVYLEKEVTVPSDVTQIAIRVDNNGGGNVWFDDLRICPSEGQMTTYTYDPLVGMTSMTDSKGMTTYYEYDSFQRLMNVKDANGKIIKHADYHYAGQ